MTITTLTDFAVLKPEIYLPLARTKLAQYIDFALFGMVDRAPIPAGEFVPIPGFKQLAGEPDVIGDGYNPTVNKIDPLKDIGVVRHLGKAFGAEDLVQIVTGRDPNAEIAAQIANYFARYAVQNSLLSVLLAVTASGGPIYATNLYSVYADQVSTHASYAVMTPTVAALGLAKIGDEMGGVRAWVMHSKVVADLTAQGHILPATNTAPVGFDGNGIANTFMGKPIVMSDTVTSTAGSNSTKYRTYGITPGALFLGIQKDLNPEADRDKLKKLNFISTDFHFCAHVRGCKWVGTANPDKTTLETAANWALSAELAKFVGVVAIDTN